MEEVKYIKRRDTFTQLLKYPAQAGFFIEFIKIMKTWLIDRLIWHAENTGMYRMMKTNHLCLFLLLAAFSFTAMAEIEPGVVTVSSDIHIEPDRASTITGNVPADAKVSILERKGTWYRIKQQSPANVQGWIWFNVQPESNLSWLERFRRVLKGGYSTRESTAVATIGIRGLGPGDIRKATPDTNELNKLDRYRSDTSRARRMAGAAGLRSQPVAYLVNPKASGTESQGGYSR